LPGQDENGLNRLHRLFDRGERRVRLGAIGNHRSGAYYATGFR
jgi:hypothetical protein